MHSLLEERQGHKSDLARLALTLALAGAGVALLVVTVVLHGARAGISVSPHVSSSTAPVDIRVRGLVAGKRATVSISSSDAAGRTWSSTALFRADEHGRIDTATMPSLAGSYTGVWRMGLIATMQAHVATGASYVWPDGIPATFRVTAIQGRKGIASTLKRERGDAPLLRARLTLQHDGVIGAYYATASDRRRPALLVFGGSEGGLASTQIAASLAAAGYPSLALAYFGEPGLPQSLSNIPLEYFVPALRWLDRQPQVDPARVFTLGVSRGSEAAQLLGVHYPTLVHGVVAVVPGDFVNCAYPTCRGSGWSLNGVPLPYEPNFGALFPFDTPSARIPDERIKGPILFICAAQDEAWPSCSYAESAMSSLSHDRYKHELLEAPDAAHEVGTLVPYEPTAGSMEATEREREALWPELLAFLARSR